MKKQISLVLSGVLGGLIVLVGMYFMNTKNLRETDTSFVKQVGNVNVSKYGNAVPLDFTKAAEKTMKSVVHIYAAEKQEVSQRRDPFGGFFGGFGQFYGPKQGTGSGVIIAENGYIVTNNHVVEFADDIQVTLADNRKYDAKVVGTYPKADLAVIKIEATDLPVMEYGDPNKAKVGEWVLAVGNPLNLTSTVTAGIISAKGRDINIIPGQDAIESFIQTDAAVNPGNSGGALVNTNGELVGINTAIASQTGSYAGYSFAVPVSIVKKVVADLKEYGTVQRALLGVNIQDVDAKLAEDLKMDKPEGVYVVNVNEGSAAEEAGIKEKDVIVKVNDTPVEKVSELQEQISRFSPGDKVTIWVNRDGKLKKFSVTLKNSLGTTEVVNKDIIQVLGASFSSISNKTKDKLKIKNGVQVSDLQAGKLMKAGVRSGFIITHINRKAVSSPKDIQNLLKNLHGGVYIQGVYPDGEIAYYAFGLE